MAYICTLIFAISLKLLGKNNVISCHMVEHIIMLFLWIIDGMELSY